VGKTTLLNRLTGEDLPTRAVSGTGEGVHTTTRRQLLQLAGGALLIDTPGMREFGLVGAGDGLAAAFADIATLAAGCRFADCTHRHEPGCAVRAAVADGTLSDERLQRYRKLCRESEFHELSYAQRRQKDRAFGRMVKTVLKQQRDT
jgi:ribosome biogenesis GTPase / thiamine phosphate phosphatase